MQNIHKEPEVCVISSDDDDDDDDDKEDKDGVTEVVTSYLVSCRPAGKTTDDLTVIDISSDGTDQDETTEIATSTQASKEESQLTRKMILF